jgi:hypothetical protein
VKRPDGLSWRPDGWIFVVRTIFFLEFGHAELSRPDGIRLRLDTQGNQRSDGKDKSSGTRATCPHGSEESYVRTALIHRLDRDPTEAIYIPGRYFSSLPHHNITFWLLVSYFLSAFGFISSLFFFLCINLTIQVFF